MLRLKYGKRVMSPTCERVLSHVCVSISYGESAEWHCTPQCWCWGSKNESCLIYVPVMSQNRKTYVSYRNESCLSREWRNCTPQCWCWGVYMNVDAEVCNYTPQRCCVTLNINIQAFRRTITHLSIDILTSTLRRTTTWRGTTTLRRTTILRGTTTLRWVKRVKADNESAMPHTRSGQVTSTDVASVDLLKGIPLFWGDTGLFGVIFTSLEWYMPLLRDVGLFWHNIVHKKR